jgi:exodeoxyribonuclease VII small subunit
MEDIKGITYEKASKELEDILSELEDDQISVDNLATKVERASKLLKFCSEKLSSTEKKVNEIVDKLGL